MAERLNNLRPTDFETKREQWITYLDGNRKGSVEPYSIQGDFFSLMHDYRIFSTVNHLWKEHDAIQGTSDWLYDYFLRSYEFMQCVKIRRLTVDGENKFSEEISLNALIEDIIAHAHLITRENYVCRTGRPYDYTPFETAFYAKTEQTLASGRRSTHASGSPEGANAWERSKTLHERFDALSRVEATNRQPGDVIANDVLKDRKTELDNTRRTIKNYANKHLAHSEPDINERDRAPAPTYKEITDALKSIYRVMNFVSTEVLDHGSNTNDPIYENNFGEDVRLPLVSSHITTEQAEAAYKKVQEEINGWQPYSRHCEEAKPTKQSS